jgi:hypothetical protein
MEVKILSGVSGSGKSHLARQLREEYSSSKDGNVVIVSADNYFLQGGVYRFDPSCLTRAHAACFRAFLMAMEGYEDHDCEWHDRYGLIIVDNTNTTPEEIAPYVLGAQAFDYQPEIVEIQVSTDDDLQKCLVRNQHGVPAQAIIAQQSRMLRRRLPAWWKVRKVPAHFPT